MRSDAPVAAVPHRVVRSFRDFVRRHPALRDLVRRTSPALALSLSNLLLRLSGIRYGTWVKQFDTLTDADREAIRQHIKRLASRPLISVIMPVFEPDEAALHAAIKSVRAQIYSRWELCIADDASTKPWVMPLLTSAAAADPRIKIFRRTVNGNISAASNSALSLAQGEFVALMDHDDLLPEHALYQVAAELDRYPEADLIYSDEDKVDQLGRRYQPHFKTDWSPDLVLGHNMVSHLGVYRRSVVDQAGGFRVGYEGSQDYDLALRVADATTPDRIRHIPRILYHWRQHAGGGSFSQARLMQCADSARRAIADHLDRIDAGEAKVVPHPVLPAYSRVIWPVPDPAPMVSLIVPTRDRSGLLARCVEGLLHRTAYQPIELLIVDNDSKEPATAALFAHLSADSRVRILSVPGPFNYAALNNHAAAHAQGDVLVLINNDIEVIQPDWLREMVSHALRPDVGAVGAKLLFPKGRVQHGGDVLGVGGVASHLGVNASRDDPGYFCHLTLARDVSAVTGACLAVRRPVYNSVGGLDEVNLPVAFNDVDFCLRLREQSHRVVWTPFAELYHHKSASRGSDVADESLQRFRREIDYMQRRWGSVLRADPFYNPNFSLHSANYLLGEPRGSASWFGSTTTEPEPPSEQKVLHPGLAS